MHFSFFILPQIPQMTQIFLSHSICSPKPQAKSVLSVKSVGDLSSPIRASPICGRL